jgi:phosphate transport system substrate-binding protein
LGGKGNEGVAGQVRQMDGAIGYVELIYALQNGMSYGSVKNAAGEFIKASLESTTTAAASLKTIPNNFVGVSITNAAGKGAYPIASFTYLLVPKQWKDDAKGKIMVDFLNWMLNQGQGMTQQLNYAPLPQPVVKTVRTMVSQIK